MQEFWELREKNVARLKVGKKTKLQYSLEDMQDCGTHWVLLINLVDSGAPHVVTNKIGGTDSDRSIIRFNHDQGLETSAHVVIFKQQTKQKKHLMLFEKSSGVPFARASSFLNNLAKLCAKVHPEKYSKPHPNGAQGKTIHTYCDLSLYAHPSDTFQSELSEGKLNDMRLVTHAINVKGYDSNAHPELSSTEVVMSVGQQSIFRSGGNWKHLQRALANASDLKMPYVRVQFSDKTGSGHTALLSSDTATIYNQDKYVKKRKISGFKSTLSTAVPIIHDEIVSKMVEIKDG